MPPAPTTPTAITLTATPKNATAIDLSWDEDAVQGKLYRSTQENFEAADGTLLGEFDSDSTTYADSGLTPETTYYYLFVPGAEDYSPGRASAETDPPPTKQWDAGEEITITGEITSDVTPQMSNEGVMKRFVFPGQEVNVTMPGVRDNDHWTRGEEEDDDLDDLTYQWEVTSFGEKGTLSSPQGGTTKWIVPPVAGDFDSMKVTLKCTVDDRPKEKAEGETGERDDDEEEASLDFTIVRTKWSAEPSIGQHPPLDENGNFDIHNPNWIDDGLIIAPDPDNGPHQVLAGARVAVAVSEAHDWDGWMRDGQGFGGGEDAPLTYTWTADKGHFAVLDARGKETESDSATGLTATWVAPSDLDTNETSVVITCTIDDADGVRVGATEAGTHDDEALERTVSVKVVKVEVTFEDQLARACAGGVAVDGVHDFTITGTAKKPDGTFPPAGTEFKLVFENNRGHDYSGDEPGIKPAGWTTEQIKKAKFVATDANGAQKLVEELTVITDEEGKFAVQVLSSDIISSDITIKVKRVDDDGQETEVGEKECKFEQAEYKRRFANPFNSAEQYPKEDNGWLIRHRWLSSSQPTTTTKVYLKFKRDSEGENEDGNWDFVAGHRILLRIESVETNDGSSAENIGDYIKFASTQDTYAFSDTATSDGAATGLLQVGEKVKQIKTIHIAAYDESQWKN